MWIASKYGFYSIVESSLKKGDFMVRARVRNDLENLIKQYDLSAQVIETLDSDYRYRIILSKADVCDLLFSLGSEIDYSNFKGKISQTEDQRDKLHAYHTVWNALYNLQKSS